MVKAVEMASGGLGFGNTGVTLNINKKAQAGG